MGENSCRAGVIVLPGSARSLYLSLYHTPLFRTRFAVCVAVWPSLLARTSEEASQHPSRARLQSFKGAAAAAATAQHATETPKPRQR